MASEASEPEASGLQAVVVSQRPTRAQHLLLLAILLNATGTGLYVAVAPIYFTRIFGLSVTEAGFGFTFASVVGLSLIAPLGYLCDRFGAKRGYMTACLAYAIAMVAFVSTHRMAEFLVVAALAGTASAASQVARPSLVRQMAGEHIRWFRTRARIMNNLGMGLGAAASAVAFQSGSPTAYRILLLCNGLSYLVCAAIVLFAVKSAAVPVARRAKSRKLVALRDRPFLIGTAINGIMALQYPVLTFAIPLWAIDRTGAPEWIVSVCLVMNTATIVSLQSRLGRKVTSLPAAGRAMRRSGAIFTVNLIMIAFAPFAPRWYAAAILLVAVFIHSVGEAMHASASQEVYYGLASADTQSEYVGVFWVGQGLALTAGPSLLALLCLGLGTSGWLIVALIFLLTGASAPHLLSIQARDTRGGADLAVAAVSTDAAPSVAST